MFSAAVGGGGCSGASRLSLGRLLCETSPERQTGRVPLPEGLGWSKCVLVVKGVVSSSTALKEDDQFIRVVLPPPPPTVCSEVPREEELWVCYMLCSLHAGNQIRSMSTVAEEVTPEDGNPECKKKTFYCKVSLFLDVFSDCEVQAHGVTDRALRNADLT